MKLQILGTALEWLYENKITAPAYIITAMLTWHTASSIFATNFFNPNEIRNTGTPVFDITAGTLVQGNPCGNFVGSECKRHFEASNQTPAPEVIAAGDTVSTVDENESEIIINEDLTPTHSKEYYKTLKALQNAKDNFSEYADKYSETVNAILNYGSYGNCYDAASDEIQALVDFTKENPDFIWEVHSNLDRANTSNEFKKNLAFIASQTLDYPSQIANNTDLEVLKALEDLENIYREIGYDVNIKNAEGTMAPEKVREFIDQVFDNYFLVRAKSKPTKLREQHDQAINAIKNIKVEEAPLSKPDEGFGSLRHKYLSYKKYKEETQEICGPPPPAGPSS